LCLVLRHAKSYLWRVGSRPSATAMPNANHRRPDTINPLYSQWFYEGLKLFTAFSNIIFSVSFCAVDKIFATDLKKWQKRDFKNVAKF
jgi:hypothetical protein